MVSSPNRAGALGKYLSALSASFEPASAKDQPSSLAKTAGRGPSGKRKRLHVLYLLNDVLHHTKYHISEGASAFANFSSTLHPHAIELVGFAASCDRAKNPKHHRRLDQLLDVWRDNGYYGDDYLDKLREIVKNAESVDAIKGSLGLSERATDIQPKGSQRDAPYLMPASHGDLSTPYYDLPAGNFVPHIIPDSSTPIRPDTVKPLQFLAGPADQKLVDVLKEFFEDVDHIYRSGDVDTSESAWADIDELGQPVVRAKKSGEIINGETYYGWTREFCLQMKKRKAKEISSQSRGHSSATNDRGRRRRYSDSSRSYSPDQRRYSKSPSSDGSRQDRRPRSGAQTRSRSRSRSNSYSPRPASPPRSFSHPQQINQPPPPPLPPHSIPQNPLYPFNGPAPFPPRFAANVPPPPPLNYNAPWPTPHAPPHMFPASGQHMIPPGMANFPQQSQNTTDYSNQYGRPGQQPMNAFPPPWQGGHQGGYNQEPNR